MICLWYSLLPVVSCRPVYTPSEGVKLRVHQPGAVIGNLYDPTSVWRFAGVIAEEQEDGTITQAADVVWAVHLCNGVPVRNNTRVFIFPATIKGLMSVHAQHQAT
jgi:hypothetical protein